VEVLMEALRLAQHKRFGASSEKSEETFMEQLSLLFNEAETFRTPQRKRILPRKKPLGRRPISVARSTSILWTTFRKAFLWSGWSAVWWVRIWCVPSAVMPWSRSARRSSAP
jgi:hypothetical protein